MAAEVWNDGEPELLQESMPLSSSVVLTLGPHYEVRFGSERGGCAAEDERPGSLQSSCQLALLDQEWIIQRREVSFRESDIVGYGGCACIVKGTYRDRPVAVKLLPRDMFTDTAVDLLEREAHIMSLLSRTRHPNIVKFVGAWFGYGTHRLRDSPLIVTELLDVDLRELCEQTHLQQPSMLSLFLDVAYGLCYLHDRAEPIVHRDINPTNIFLRSLPGGQNWRAKIGDFGSANLASRSTSLGGGTVLYSAPETLPSTVPDTNSSRAQPAGITVKADIYSYGVLLLEVAMGRVPENEGYKRLVEGLGSKWPQLHSLVVWCTQHDPLTRPTASQVLDTLEHTVMTSLDNV